ncbi:MAG: DUF262 domain-containing HNH endonuclease family protein [Leptotrichia hongkongensis]|nr:DUF262 domain-containing HNH endonuclease family protein [Leptotrichia hongkongensis]
MISVKKQNIMELLENSEKVFIIPPFQRNYEWEEIQCKELFEDIKLIANDKNKRHYLGNVVFYINEENDLGEEYILIDGQQRVTTILIFLCALRDCDENGKLPKNIYRNYLEHGIENSKFKTKLKQTLYDQDAFSALVLKESFDKNNKIFRNYDYFKELIKDEELKTPLTKLYKALKKIEIASIELVTKQLEAKDDLETVQRIFEKINSTGKPLTKGDLIRNFLLLTKNLQEQEELYKNYWLKIEKRLLSENISIFAKDYLVMKIFEDVNDSEVYKKFKQVFGEDGETKEKILKEMTKYSEYYSWILEPNKLLSTQNKKKEIIKKLIEEIKYIGAIDFRSLLMLLLEKMYDEKNIIELEKILKLLRDFLLRYRVVKVSRGGGGLTGVVTDLIKKISTNEIECNYENIYFELSNSKNPSGKFPKDDEFKQALQESVDETYAKLVLSIIEKNEKPNDIPIDVSKITIEHIMPKKLNSSWEKDLGNDAVSIHEKFLKSIGNQVPLSKKWNSSLSNKVFIEKRRKYIEQQFSITREISDFEKWGEEELIKRNKDISERACNYIISPLKRSRDYDDDEVITFEDKIEDTKNKKIRAILYNDKEYIIKNWKDLIYKISEILYENIKNKFKTVSAQKKLLIVSVNDKEKLKNAKQIKNSEFYCETEIKLAKDSFKYAGIVAKHFNQEDKFKIIVGNEEDK